MGKKAMINPGWENYKRLTFAPAVRKGNMLFITGQDASQTDPANWQADDQRRHRGADQGDLRETQSTLGDRWSQL